MCEKERKKVGVEHISQNLLQYIYIYTSRKARIKELQHMIWANKSADLAWTCLTILIMYKEEE